MLVDLQVVTHVLQELLGLLGDLAKFDDGFAFGSVLDGGLDSTEFCHDLNVSAESDGDVERLGGEAERGEHVPPLAIRHVDLPTDALEGGGDDVERFLGGLACFDKVEEAVAQVDQGLLEVASVRFANFDLTIGAERCACKPVVTVGDAVDIFVEFGFRFTLR